MLRVVIDEMWIEWVTGERRRGRYGMDDGEGS